MILTLDFETRSEADLRKVGAWAYSEHKSTEVICAGWALGDEPVQEWNNRHLGQVYPNPAHSLGMIAGPHYLLKQAEEPTVLFEAHNVAFEYSIWKNVCVERMGWPDVPLERWRDTMATACYYALPAALDSLCRVLGLPGKDPRGERLITKYCKLHLATVKREIPPEDLQAFLEYVTRDVEQEREVGRLLGDLPEDELRVFLHDFEVAARGLLIDVAGVARARKVVDQVAAELAREFRELSGGAEVTQRDKVLALLREAPYFLELPDLTAGTIEEFLDEGRVGGQPIRAGDPRARRILELRRRHSKASTKKLDAMARQRGRDGRARFQTRYHGAVTGRNTGQGFQPLNLIRGSFKGASPEQLVRDIGHGDPAYLAALYGDPMDAVSKASRHWIMAGGGNRLMAGDYASVEAVVNACLAGEEWKVEAFRQPDPRVYETAAEKIYRLPPGTVTKDTHPLERQDGKVCELAFGYQGALGAWRKFDTSGRHSDEAVIGFVRGWREGHPMIMAQWRGLEDAAIEATMYSGRVTGHRQIGFERVDGWLTMILPDGKRLWYWAPQLRMAWPQWHQPAEREDCATGECDCRKRLQLTYQAQKEGRWRRVHTYGGKLTENAVQAVSRQILKAAELRVKAAGYQTILSVYDEIVAEVMKGRGSIEELARLMEEPAGDWCADWPIRVEAWEGARYKK